MIAFPRGEIRLGIDQPNPTEWAIINKTNFLARAGMFGTEKTVIQPCLVRYGQVGTYDWNET